MDCKQCTDDLTAYQDGELSDKEAKQMRFHLDACPACANEFHSLQKATTFVHSNTRQLEPRLETWNSVRAQIAASQRIASPSRFLGANRWLIATAALLILAGLGLGYMQYQQIQRRSLERYMAQYIREREAHKQVQPFFADMKTKSHAENPHANNPFIEIQATPSYNPFRSEDR